MSLQIKNEIWKDVVGYEGLYKVSDMGRVKNVPRTFKMRDGRNRTIKEEILMKFKVDKDGYFKIGLRKEGKQLHFFVHRLVAQAFVNNPNFKPQVNHIDGIKNNNSVSNLEWVTHQENRTHAAENGLVPDQWGGKNPNVKLTEPEVLLVKELRNKGLTLLKISEIVGTSVSNVKNITYGYTWAWLNKKEVDQK